MRLFISYSHDDKPWVHELWRALRDRGHHNAWIDQRLTPAQDWWDSILNHIEQADSIIYVMTPKAVASIYCLAEMEYALAINKPVIPLMLKPCDAPGILHRRRVQYELITDSPPLDYVLFTIERALRYIQIDILQGRHAPPDPLPDRPEEPKPTRNREQVTEVFMLAEEAASKDNTTLAEKLFQQVIHAAPRGYGQAATQRLAEIRFEQDRATEYSNILQMTTNPALRKGAQALWRSFVGMYGEEYDPDGIAPLLTEFLPEPSAPHRVPVSDILPPPFDWVEIPAGQVTVEDVGDFDVPAFAIARYPVTNAQFARFVESEGGYEDDRWWDFSSEAQQWRAQKTQPQKSRFDGDDLPRTDVTWYEAVAFCRWLSELSGEDIMLPTEQQWQWAAQGDEGWVYPWGDEFDAKRCNSSVKGKSKGTTPVTQHPDGASPFGVMDMVGNVWEWCLTSYATDSPALDDTGSRVLRGGCWGITSADNLRAAFRDRDRPRTGNYLVGFRCARAILD